MAAGVSIRAEYLCWITSLCLLISGIGGFKDVTYSVEEQAVDDFEEIDFGYHGYTPENSLVRLRRQVVQSSLNETTTSGNSESTTTQQASTKAPSNTTLASTSTTTSPTTSTSPTNTSTSSTSTTVKSTSSVPPNNSTLPPVHEETVVEEEHNHTYYDSKTLRGPSADGYWVDLNDPSYQKKTHGTLSNSHRTAATVVLKFKFVFYGHEVAKVTIATGGFLYMSDFLHQWLTATQYIAPLMANFDTQLGNDSQIHYADNGTAFIVQWENVYLQDNPDYGRFNFQAILLKTGSVIFVYKEVPVSVSSIKSAAHPVKVGLSDAYYYDSQISTEVRRRTIYEYHRVNISFSKVASDTVIVMNPRPTCVQFDSCEECTSGKIGFDCRWCPAVRRCSDGLDRKRQEWHKKGCSSLAVEDVELTNMCDFDGTTEPSTTSNDIFVIITNMFEMTTPTTKENTDASTFSTSPDNQIQTSQSPNSEVVKTTSSAITDSGNATNNVSTTTNLSEMQKKCLDKNYVRDSGMCARAAHWRSDRGQSKAAVKPVTVIIPVVIILIVLLGVFWFIYAYRNPQSQSGMWLIEHRPSNLKAKLNNVRFWKRNGTGGEKYEVSMQPEGESVA